MNNELSILLKNKIKDFSFIDRITGAVTTLSIANNNDANVVFKKYPIAIDVTSKDCMSGKYNDLIPNSNKKSIIYFEDYGTIKVKEYYESKLRLVGWFNMNKLGLININNTTVIQSTIINALTGSTFNGGSFNRVHVTLESIEPKSNAIFSKYTYDESVLQYLLYPFDYFALNLKVKFRINSNCLPVIELSNEIKCEEK